jgi:SAM-dependent methyltransferase
MSQVGECWRGFYRAGNLSWYDPATFSVERLVRLTQSEWITRLLRACRLRPGPRLRVLEAGCGTGQFALALALAGCDVEAFDYNEEALEIARHLARKVQAAGHPIALRLFRDDLLAPRSAPGQYDLVFNQAVLEYFCADAERQRALQQMTRLARPGGWVAAIVQHTGHSFQRVWRRMGWEGYTNQPPLTVYTPGRLARELRQSGLARVRLDGVYPWQAFFWPPWYRRWKWAEQVVYLLGQGLRRAAGLPRPVRSRLALQILGAGRKPAETPAA